MSPGGEERRTEGSSDVRWRGNCFVTALGDVSQVKRALLCRELVPRALPLLLPREHVGQGCKVRDIQGVQRGLQAPVVGTLAILHVSRFRVVGDRDSAEGCARGFRREPGSGTVRGQAFASGPVGGFWCPAPRERRRVRVHGLGVLGSSGLCRWLRAEQVLIAVSAVGHPVRDRWRLV